eukprot:12272826-Alexandrium_andersonii.AAC.1
MSASLVGSEMCIRDRFAQTLNLPTKQAGRCPGSASRGVRVVEPTAGRPVSYTHLTLPTICSV